MASRCTQGLDVSIANKAACYCTSPCAPCIHRMLVPLCYSWRMRMRLNNRGSLAHGGTNPSLTNGSSSRMRGEREEQKERRGEENGTAWIAPGAGILGVRRGTTDGVWDESRCRRTHTHTAAGSKGRRCGRINNGDQKITNQDLSVYPPPGVLCMAERKVGGSEAACLAILWTFFQLLRENVAFRPHVLLQLCIHVLSSALFKNGVRRTEYVLLRSAITSASAQYGRQKKKTDHLNRMLQMA